MSASRARSRHAGADKLTMNTSSSFGATNLDGRFAHVVAVEMSPVSPRKPHRVVDVKEEFAASLRSERQVEAVGLRIVAGLQHAVIGSCRAYTGDDFIRLDEQMALERPFEDLPQPLAQRKFVRFETACADFHVANFPRVGVFRTWRGHQNPIWLTLFQPYACRLADRTDFELIVDMVHSHVDRIRTNLA